VNAPDEEPDVIRTAQRTLARCQRNILAGGSRSWWRGQLERQVAAHRRAIEILQQALGVAAEPMPDEHRHPRTEHDGDGPCAACSTGHSEETPIERRPGDGE
jgi:hypothetical protein